MTIGQLLFWIIVAIIAYFLIQISLVILIIAIIVLVIYYIFNAVSNSITPTRKYTYEGYKPYSLSNLNNYGRSQIKPDHNKLFQNNNWYIPVQQYYNEKINSMISSNYILPQSTLVHENDKLCPPFIISSTSEYCVNKQMQETGDLELSISKCGVPGKICEICSY